VNAVHTGLFLTVSRAMRVLGMLNLVTATLVLAGGLAPAGPWRYALWAAAMAVLVSSPRLNPIHEFTISAAHFVERHGLVVIIAIGESIVAIGVGAAGLPVDMGLVVAAVLGLSLSYLMWWVYFEGGDGGAEHALTAVPMRHRAWVAIVSYGYAHYFLLIGVVAVAAGMKKAVGHAAGHLTAGQALVLAGGVACYLAGDVWFRRSLRIGVARYRLVAAGLAFATVPFGLYVGGAQMLALAVLLLVTLYVEARFAAPAPDHRPVVAEPA
jgi:low temperature requirement protein LtrA